jgi:hypothetical protein
LELEALVENVNMTVARHRGATARFLTDVECVASIKAVMGNDTELVGFFESEKEGMYKADLCRGAALWETGGLYFDVDLGVRMNLWGVLNPNTTFATVQVYKGSKRAGSFFQAFMAATPRHPVILRYVELFLDFYRGKFTYLKRFSGVVLLRMAYDEILAKDPSQAESSEIWHEFRYNHTRMPDVPPPTWGTRGACSFVVVTNPNNTNMTVPFYSRIANSRMCPSAEEVERKKRAKEFREIRKERERLFLEQQEKTVAG